MPQQLYDKYAIMLNPARSFEYANMSVGRLQYYQGFGGEHFGVPILFYPA